jgi:hypothetical protein
LGVARSPGESPFADRVSLGGDGRLRIVAVVSGAAKLIAVDGSISALPLGQSFLLPASSPVVQLVTDRSGSGETSAVVLVAELNDINSVISLTG